MFLHIIDRKTAKAHGLKFYFTGMPCLRGMCALRRTSSAKCRCRPCQEANLISDTNSRDRSRLWRESNPDKQKEHERRWRDINRDHERERIRQFHLDNPSKRSEYRKNYDQRHPGKQLARKCKYYRDNPDKSRVYVTRRRAAKLNRTPAWLTVEHKAAIVAIYKEAARRRKDGEDVHVDHVVPLAGKLVCGLHVPWNLAIITARENQKKNNRFEP